MKYLLFAVLVVAGCRQRSIEIDMNCRQDFTPTLLVMPTESGGWRGRFLDKPSACAEAATKREVEKKCFGKRTKDDMKGRK